MEELRFKTKAIPGNKTTMELIDWMNTRNPVGSILNTGGMLGSVNYVLRPDELGARLSSAQKWFHDRTGKRITDAKSYRDFLVQGGFFQPLKNMRQELAKKIPTIKEDLPLDVRQLRGIFRFLRKAESQYHIPCKYCQSHSYYANTKRYEQ